MTDAGLSLHRVPSGRRDKLKRVMFVRVCVLFLLRSIATREDVSWITVYNFVSNRMRCILQDMTIQVRCVQQIMLFHIQVSATFSSVYISTHAHTHTHAHPHTQCIEGPAAMDILERMTRFYIYSQGRCVHARVGGLTLQ